MLITKTFIFSTHFDSRQAGNCQICGGRCDEVFVLKIKKHPVCNYRNLIPSILGHKECLEKRKLLIENKI